VKSTGVGEKRKVSETSPVSVYGKVIIKRAASEVNKLEQITKRMRARGKVRRKGEKYTFLSEEKR